MRFLIVGNCSDAAQTAAFRSLEEAEGKALWELYGAGVLQQALFGEEMGCLAFVFECRSSDEVQQFIRTLPSAKAELIDYRVSKLGGLAAFTEQFIRHHSKLPPWLY